MTVRKEVLRFEVLSKVFSIRVFLIILPFICNIKEILFFDVPFSSILQRNYSLAVVILLIRFVL